MNWPEFHHEAMATTFAIVIADHPRDYARQAAAAAFRDLDRLESELSRYIESSDIARANRLACGETITIGEDALECLLIAADASLATDRAFDAAYASERLPGQPADAPLFTLDPAAYTLTSHAARLHLDLGAVGKGYALDRMAARLAEWAVTTACLQGGGSTALALAAPAGHAGWPVGIGESTTQRTLSLTHAALSGSGVAVKGAHLIDPRSGAASARTTRAWALAPTGALSDALSTAFFLLSEAEVAAFCAQHPGIGAASVRDETELVAHGALAPLI
ncbi:MAG: FAD:protein FMN transferase [Verrucomicrobia bacterium]|nr:FAD:protein FMN transferase [Verrucomicrobiota bacterium]